eukprot:scaffold285022_cov14-Tisochrysis_lutea.AAC.1
MSLEPMRTLTTIKNHRHQIQTQAHRSRYSDFEGVVVLCVDSMECAYDGSQESFYLITRAPA